MSDPSGPAGPSAVPAATTTRRDLGIVGCGFALAYGASLWLEPFEWISRFDQAHPGVHLDDLAIAVMASCLLLAWFAARRWRELMREAAALRAAGDALARTHGEVIEQRRALEEGAAKLTAARDAALAASNVKSAFLRTMSHELRTPLNAIIGFSELLVETVPAGLERPTLYATQILECSRNLLRMIDDILDGSRMDLGDVVPYCEEFDVVDLIDACLPVLRPLATLGGVALTVTAPGTLPITADEKMLTRLLLNLVTNAVKFTESGGSVELRAGTVREDPDGTPWIELVIADTGIGMTEAEVEIALQPFRQVDGSLTRRHGGVGLGLPLARRLAQRHGGSLSVTSVRGQGTTVRVLLPGAGAAPVEPAEAVEAQA